MVVRRFILGLSLATLIAVAGLALAQATPERASAGPPPTTVSIVPAALNADRGATIEVDVEVTDVTNLGAYQFEIEFDPAVLTPIYVVNGDFLGSTGRTVGCTPPVLNPYFACFTFGMTPPTGPSGSGVLATVVFTTSCNGGATALTLEPLLSDPAGNAIASQAQDGSVTLNTDPCATSDPDSDLDGCTDSAEQQTAMGSETSGGRRDYQNFWDFFDTPNASNVRDGAVASADFFRVVGRFGATGNPAMDPLSMPPPTGYHTAFDRGPASGDPWDLTAPNGSISAADYFATLQQFGHTCA
jgi:general secretion pathway protein D